MRKKYLAILLALTALFLLAACNGGGDSSDMLTANLWALTELDGQPPLPETFISAEFSEDGRVGGSAGCNNYSTSYTVDGDSISFGDPVAMTMKLCPDPFMVQENAYLQALSEAASYEISDDTLELSDVDGDVLAVYAAQSQELAGSSWDVISYNNGRGGVVSLIIGTEITANFGEDDQLTGNAGCNDYTGSYEADGDNISIGPAAVTRKFCADPEGVMEQESEYLAALETAATYKIEGNTMNMRTSEGSTVANFIRASE
jgi:heat shock protein HslJ